MLKRCVLLIGLLAPLAVQVSADEIVFKDGDKLTGTVTSLADGKVNFHSPLAGDVKVNVADISTMSTDQPIDVVLSDGTASHRKLVADGAGQVQLEGGLLGNSKVSLSDIASINPPKAEWSGDIKFGGLLNRGNTFTDSINLGVDLKRQTDKDSVTFDANYAYGRSKDRTTGVTTTTADNWKMDLKYEYDFTKKLYGFAEGIVTKDRLAFLDLGFYPSAGLGYRWWNRPDFTFATEGGIAWIYENYTNLTPTRQDVALKLAYHLTKTLNDKVSLFHNLSYYPSIENGSVFLVSTDAGLHTTLSKHLFTELKISLDYDARPAVGALKTNTQYQLNVGYTF